MQFIKDFFLNFRNKSLAKRVKSIARRTADFRQSQRIGILFNLPQNASHQALNNFVAELAAEGKQVQTLCYFEQEHQNPYQFKFDFFTQKDIALTGEVKAKEVEQFISQPFDFLFCIQQQPRPELDYVLLQSKALCRVGVFDENRTNCFELMVKTSAQDSLQNIISTMLSYTKALTNNGK